MEKHAAPKPPKNNIFKFLPKAATSAVTFQNPQFSPSREHNKLKAHAGKGFSGPMVSIIPDEARRKSKNESFETCEPSSPKVSCMGQIKKHKQKKKINKIESRVSLPKDVNKPSVFSPKEVKKHASKFRRLFSGAKPGRKSDVVHEHGHDDDDNDEHKLVGSSAPVLGQMKRFKSGRDAFSNFDWAAHQIAPVESDHRCYYSDEDRGDCSSDEEDQEDVIIPFSAPMTVGGGAALQPRKEINIWKRRTVNPPRPLQLNRVIKAN